MTRRDHGPVLYLDGVWGLGPEVKEAAVEAEVGGKAGEVAVPQVRGPPVQQAAQALRPKFHHKLFNQSWNFLKNLWGLGTE